MAKSEAWFIWEKFVQDVLKLRSTIASGNKFYDPSDGVDTDHYLDSDFRLMVDAKCTKHPSYRLDYKMLNQWVEKAQSMGFRFALPVRLLEGDADGVTDYVVCSLNDFAELVDSFKTREKPKEEVEVFSKKDLRFMERLMKSSKDPDITLILADIYEKMEGSREFR